MFEFKSQKWFDIFLELIEFPTNFRGLNYLNLIQTNGLKREKCTVHLGRFWPLDSSPSRLQGPATLAFWPTSQKQVIQATAASAAAPAEFGQPAALGSRGAGQGALR
jgi:hypothetical protein